MMRGKTMLAAVPMMMGLVAAPARPASVMPNGGTIAVTSPPGIEHDVSTEAATAALGMRGFTILNDPSHAAYVAEVVTTRTEVGTSMQKGPSGRALATGGGVNVPLSQGKSVLVPMQRTEVGISIRARGGQAVLWHGAAVTVRSEGARDGGADQVALALSQAALSSYPTQTKGVISIP